MMPDYYDDLIDSRNVSTAAGAKAERDRVQRIEEGRRSALLESAPFKHIEAQTVLASKMVEEQKRTIDELKQQTESLKTQIRMVEEAEEKARRKAKWATAGFWLTTAIAVAALIISILAWLLPRQQ